MTKANTDHRSGDGLMSGLKIESGIPNNVPGSNGEDNIDVVGGGTLAGLALRKNSTGAPTPVLVTCQHVMAGKELTLTHTGVEDYYYRDAQGTEIMYHPHRATTNEVGINLDEEPVLQDPINRVYNLVDLATCDVKAGVKVGYNMHDPHHSGTGRSGSGAHATRKIVSGVVEPKVGMEVTLLGAEAGEGTASITAVGLDNQNFGRRYFNGVMEIGIPTRNPYLGDRYFGGGDSGAPVLAKIQDGVYRMVGILFAVGQERQEDDTFRVTKLYAFPASTAQTEAGIIFGEPLPAVPSLNEMDSFDDYVYGDWRALTDFDDVEHRLHNVDLYNSRVRWLGSSVPGAGPNYHWWNASVSPGSANPTSVRFSVRGSPEIDEDFAQGRRW